MFKGRKEVSMHQSPIKEKQLKGLTEDQREVLHELQNLFTYYASKFDRLSYHELSQKGFNEIVSKLLKKDKGSAQKSPGRPTEQARQGEILEKRLRLLYYSKGNSQAATFDQFLDLIPQMANIIYESMNKEERVQLMTSDIRFLYKREVLTLLDGKLINISFVLREDTYNYAVRLLPEFEKIYKVYFAHELNKNIKKTKYKDESLKYFFTFLKDFEVMPKLVTAGQAYFIYDEANRNPQSDCFNEVTSPEQEGIQERPVCFSLGKFVACLIIVARNCYGKLRQIDPSEQAEINEKEAFKAFLEEIEMNKAYKNSRHLKQTNQTYSFILLDEYPKEYELAKSRKTAGGLQISKPMEKKTSEFIRLLNNMDL